MKPTAGKTSTVLTADVPISFALKIAKVDTEKREVEGVASQEVVDAHGEIVDHASLKAVLAAWPGNIREMHQPKAVGKAMQVVSDDEAKATIVRSYISKGAEDTWQKVLDGTLSMYSIGGTGKIVTAKNADGQEEKRILMSSLSEISLVDNGACPTAKFEIVKMVDGVATDVTPADEAPHAETKTEPTAVDAADVDTAKATSPRDALLTLLGTEAGSLKHPQAGAAAARAIAKISAVPVRKDGYPESYDIQQALTAIAVLESLLASEWWEAREELVAGAGNPDAEQVDQAQLALLRNAVNLVIAFLVSEFDEQFSAFDETEPAEVDPSEVAMAHRARGAAAIAKHFDLTTALAAIAKAGARHSKNDVEMIQKMHDTSVSLGAACATEKAQSATPAASPAVEKIEPAPAVTASTEKVVAAPDVQAIVKAAVDEATKSLKATSDETIAKLEARIDKLANTPKPGGPIARAVAVEKTLAGSPEKAPASTETDEVLKAFDTLASVAKTTTEKLALAQQKVAYMHRTGAGAVHPITGQPLEA